MECWEVNIMYTDEKKITEDIYGTYDTMEKANEVANQIRKYKYYSLLKHKTKKEHFYRLISVKVVHIYHYIDNFDFEKMFFFTEDERDEMIQQK